MQYRELGNTGWKVSSVSMGCWAIGAAWGPVDDRESMAALRRAVELGVNFFDTADVYGDGKSERLVAKVRKETKADMVVATKVGRRLDPHVPAEYNERNLTAHVERCLNNLETDCLDLVQLHCPPTEVYYMREVFDIMDGLVRAGKIRHYGVSVEKVEEAIKASEYPGVQSIQLIYNMFRQRPADLFFGLAQNRNLGIIVRVPLASGLLTGKIKAGTQFAPDDHRAFNRQGEAFDRGETFAGVELESGLKAVEELEQICPQGMTMAQFALRWILEAREVTCTIPGAKRPSQVEDNAAAADAAPLSPEVMQKVRDIYNRYIRDQVHHRW